MLRAHRTLHPVRVGQGTQQNTYQLPDGYNRSDVKQLGSGSYGSVIRTVGTTARVNAQGTRIEVEVAVKKFRDPMQRVQYAQRCYRELKLLQHLDHPNIARILDLFTPALYPQALSEVFLVTEYAGSTLDKHIKDSADNNQPRLPLNVIPRIIRDTLSALQYLKAANVLHRDLKPSNLAVNGQCKAVLIDYGLARIKDDSSPLTAEVYTKSYCAPEVMFWEAGSYGSEADLWSIGCILAELITWNVLFEKVPSSDAFVLYVSLFGKISDNFIANIAVKGVTEKIEKVNRAVKPASLSDHFAMRSKVVKQQDPTFAAIIDFLKQCVQFDPSTRITLENALRHPFLSGVYVAEDSSYVSPLHYNDDGNRDIAEWKQIIFNEISHFRPREDTPKP